MPVKQNFPIRLATIDCGTIAGAHIGAFLKYRDKLTISALCDINPEALK